MPQTFSFEDIMAMDQRYRGLFVNSLSGYKSANLIGTVDSKGNTNLSIVSSVVHIGANPPLIAFIQRPVSVERHTYDNIMETQVYTINAIADGFIPKAHQTSARYEKMQSEFEYCGLTPEFKANFPAPFVAESPLQVGVKFVQEMDIELNGTKMIIGQIEQVSIADDSFISEDGAIDIAQLKIAAVSSLDGYAIPQTIDRYAYAKPDAAPTKLKL